MIRVGVAATFMTLATFLAFRLLPGGAAIPLQVFVPLWTAALVVGLVATFAPWERLFASKLGRWILYGWSVVDIVLITALIGWVPEEDPIFFLCYALTTLFFSMLYTRRSQILLFLFTVGCYSTLHVGNQTETTVADFVLRVGLLGAIALLSSFSSRELMRGVLRATQHRSEIEREKALYESLATAQSDLGEGISIVELDSGKITFVNEAFCRIYGYTE